MILLIDNYDSFTYNLYQYFAELGAEVLVRRNDELSCADALSLNPKAIIASPGPGLPKDAGITKEIINKIPSRIPFLGVCLGHQSLGEAFGCKVVEAPVLMHGKTSVIKHDKKTIFHNLNNNLTVMRYHSFILDIESITDEFEISASDISNNEIMAIRHKKRPMEGVQFHPESIMTDCGKDMIKNFLSQYIDN